jgi:hypothetical protein
MDYGFAMMDNEWDEVWQRDEDDDEHEHDEMTVKLATYLSHHSSILSSIYR